LAKKILELLENRFGIWAAGAFAFRTSLSFLRRLKKRLNTEKGLPIGSPFGVMLMRKG
jgi:hypothetical protein